MTEFYNLPPVQPVGADELLIVRDRIGKRATVADLLQAASTPDSDSGDGVALSETPPTDKALWWQTVEGLPVDFWMLRPGGVWVSAESWRHSVLLDSLTSNKLYRHSNPTRNGLIWLDYFTVRGRSNSNFPSGKKWRFELNLINSQLQEVDYYFLELEGLSEGEVFSKTEYMGESVAQNDALAIWQRVNRIANAPKIRSFSLSTSFRRVYSAQSV